jgi:hypothetical protein
MAAGNDMLAHARDLIASSWTQQAEARNTDGVAVDPWDPTAVSWSLLGALVASYERLVWSDGPCAALEALACACLLLGNTVDSSSREKWNDMPGRTSLDVLDALDEARASSTT